MPNHLLISEFFTPNAFVKEVIIPQENNNMGEGGGVITHGEFLVCIGMWFMMKPLKVFSAMVFGEIAQLIPLRRPHTTSIPYFLGPALRKF